MQRAPRFLPIIPLHLQRHQHHPYSPDYPHPASVHHPSAPLFLEGLHCFRFILALKVLELRPKSLNKILSELLHTNLKSNCDEDVENYQILTLVLLSSTFADTPVKLSMSSCSMSCKSPCKSITSRSS